MQCYDVKVKVDTVQNTCSLHGQASLLSFLDADSGKDRRKLTIPVNL